MKFYVQFTPGTRTVIDASIPRSSVSCCGIPQPVRPVAHTETERP